MKLNNNNICSNISKNRVAGIHKRSHEFSDMFLNRKLKHAIKVATPDIEKKQDKLTCESNPSEKYE